MNKCLMSLQTALLLGLWLWVAPVSLAASVDSQRLMALYNQGQFQAAYDLAKQQLADGEGEPLFDMYYGMAALETGHLNEAVFALERVLIIHPEQLRARLELARAYFLLNEDVRARQEFEKVLASNPPENVKTNIRTFLDRIRLRESRYKTSAKAFAEVGIGHDTNANSGPGTDSFVSPVLGVLLLDPVAQEIEDEFMVVKAGGQLSYPHAPGQRLFFGADASQQFYDALGKHAATRIINFYGGNSWIQGENYYSVTGQIQKLELDETLNFPDNRLLYALNGEWRHNLDRRTQFNVVAQVAQLDYPDQSVRDSTLVTGGVGVRRAYDMTYKPVLSVNLFTGAENPHNLSSPTARAAAERDFLGASVGAQLSLSSTVSAAASLLYQANWYREENFLFGKTRRDKYLALDLNARWLIDDNWSVNGQVLLSRNDSNIVVNDYDRVLTQVNLRYEFH
jgi:tetratricopeptide (TPR) repeat protein